MISKTIVLFSFLSLASVSMMGQSLFESAGKDTINKQSWHDMIQLGGYTRGVIYIGENNDKPEVSSGYGEAALKLSFTPDEKISFFTEFRLR